MGYEFHITRARNWVYSEQAPIEASEWLALVGRDPELRLYGANGPYFAVWKDSTGNEDDWLDWHKGRIYTKNPRELLIAKMLRIAEGLNATVQGDEGETYPLDEDESTEDYFG